MYTANLLSNDKCDVVHHNSRQPLQIRMLCIIEFLGFPCWIQPGIEDGENSLVSGNVDIIRWFEVENETKL